MIKRALKLIRDRWVWLVAILLIAGVSHGINMFNYPYFENDEGTYLSQGYAAAYLGQITHYTYWYDHVPLGWFLMGVWLRLTGGPFTFGFSLNSGRILMLLVQIVNAGMIFEIVRRLTQKKWVGMLAVILFSLSPLAIYFHRRLLLDNLMTMWMLASLLVLMAANKRLTMILASSLAFTLAILTKETAVFALPAYLAVIPQVVSKKQRLASWICFVMPVLIGGLYFVGYALLKNELLPGDDHVSLIGTWKFHLSRGNHEPFWSSTSDFYGAVKDWMGKDPLFTVAMALSTGWTVIMERKRRLAWTVGFVSVLMWVFLMRGGLVINFYVIPLVAFGAMLTAIFLSKLTSARDLGIIGLGMVLTIWLTSGGFKQWWVNETAPQLAATEWVKQNLDPKAVISIDHSQLIDLQLSRFPGDPAFTNAHWFWKLDRDPEIKESVLANDWKNIEYFVLTHEYLKQIKQNNIPYISPTMKYSTSIASWGPESSDTYLNLDQQISTNGDWAKVFRRYDYQETLLADNWIQYKKDFITPDGQVIDPQSGKTTSEGQAYALLRALIADDKASFAIILNWTTSHLENRRDDALFSWWWGKRDDGKIGVVDSGWATDADIDIATALVLAANRWEIEDYQNLALIITRDIWKQSVFELEGTYYLIAGTWAQYGEEITVNPSYLSPAAFRIFGMIDPDHPWKDLADDSYELLNRLSGRSRSGLVPDWIEVNKETQALKATTKKGLGNNFSYDAMRIYWRVAQDALWFGDSRAIEWLKSQNFLANEWQSHGKIIAGYSLGGSPMATYEDASFYGAWLPAVKVADPQLFTDVEAKLQSMHTDSYWTPKDNYYTQNWAFLGYALAQEKFIPYGLATEAKYE